jgi:hypothetical protein
MSLDGLRAWISEVERKLAVRTGVGLVLLALGIGAGAAAIYLALHTADRSATKDELRQLQGGAASEAGSTQLSSLEARVEAAQQAAEAAERRAAALEAKLPGADVGGGGAVAPEAQGGPGAAATEGSAGAPEVEGGGETPEAKR